MAEEATNLLDRKDLKIANLDSKEHRKFGARKVLVNKLREIKLRLLITIS